MKAAVFYTALLALLILVVPMIALDFSLTPDDGGEIPVHSPAMPESAAPEAARDAARPLPEKEEEAAGEVAAEVPLSDKGVDAFLILDESSGEVIEVSLRDFVRGAVAAEMPVSFHSEALKAQAVAAHTFALHNHYVQRQSPDPALKGADFSADPSNLKVYTTEEAARAFYGESADRSWSKICKAADSVLSYILEYEEEPIVAAYHAISAGQTEDAANVWTGSAPYLHPAESEGDLLAPDYESTVKVTAEELRAALEKSYPDIALGADPAQWLGGEERSESGYVVQIQVGDGLLHGLELRNLLDLRSHNFKVAYEDGVFTFQVLGYGHGVGLSQYGADFLARQGYSFREILENYYTGTVLKQVAAPKE